MTEELAIGPGTSLRVLVHDDQALELEATYAPGGTPPPAHFHPEQDERFEVLAGAMHVRLDGRDCTIGEADVLEVPRGTVHQMWNEGAEPAAMRWRRSPPAGLSSGFGRSRRFSAARATQTPRRCSRTTPTSSGSLKPEASRQVTATRDGRVVAKTWPNYDTG